MTQYKKGDTVLATCKDADRVVHITLLKLLKDPSRDTGEWNDYTLVQINHKEKTVHWPRYFTNARFEPRSDRDFTLTTDIDTIMNFKKDYVKTVFESGYKLK